METFHRRKSPTQTEEVARRQEASGEIWGRLPFGWDIPAVEAYRGPLPPAREGVEFETDTKPDGPYGSYVTWSKPENGVWFEDGFAKIRVRVTTVRYLP